MNFPSDQHDCYYATDPRANKELSTSLAGKTAVVVGAGRGVGRACSEFLATASVRALALLALEQDEVDETAKICKEVNSKIQIKTLAVDNTDYEEVAAAMAKIETDFGQIDILLMNAGRPPQWLDTAESDPGIWWETVAISLKGAFNCTRAVLPGMQRNKSGRIIFTASNGANFSGGIGSYIIGKLGQVRFAETIHAEYSKEYNIKCFAYHPGCIKTRFFTDFESYVKGTDRSDPIENGQATKSYVADNVPFEDKSAYKCYMTLKDAVWDTPYMAAGLVTVIASGKLDFMSGRYLEAGVDIQKYLDQEENIVRGDLCRVRLNLGNDELRPRLDF